MMKLIKTKLSAFTLLEITISMLIVAIIMGFAYYSLLTFTTIFSSQQEKKLDHFQRDLFVYKIRKDCDNSFTIAYDQRNLSLLDSVGTINYFFLDSIILRDQYQLRTDTFYIRHDEPEIVFMEYVSEQPTLVHSMEINLYFEDKQVPLFISKEYDAQQLIHPNFTE